ncbi:hypothetical protein Egran_02115 [Elaphomyces granulatus]|uniref:Uncharacterized protein n=1 Tax=Elaphomyces granulatus TaxID=519963 RepID=A0A232M141_9EURO|nr:hypothetical protein Egran_02115 [Elaphomyces granulatus]
MRRCGDLYLLTSVGKEELNSGRLPVIAQAAKNENLRKQAIMALIFLQCPRKLIIQQKAILSRGSKGSLENTTL